MKLLQVKSVEEVKEIIKNAFTDIDRYEEIDLSYGLNRILGEDIYSAETLPPFARSSVDGYAVLASDTFGAGDTMPTFLQALKEVEMGEEAPGIQMGETRYVPTGGMLPPLANAVVMVEYTEKLGDQIMVYRQVAPGENVINAGDDVKTGELVMRKGVPLREAELGALAALGFNTVKVYTRPILGILSTGNELVPPGEQEIKKGQIRDINSIILSSIAQKYGAQVIQGGIVGDDFPQILHRAEELLEKVDVLLLSGGSSVGTYDYTLQILQKLSQNNMLVEGIGVKPGKPTLLAKQGNKGIWGLPGHPVSAMMIFNYFGKYMLNTLSGNIGNKHKKTLKALLNRNIPSGAGRTDWIRVKVVESDAGFQAVPVFGKSSLITTLVESQGFIEIPTQKEGLEAGTWVEIIFWD
ncbi:MAG: gephyrin-like molybdotransferase Glp [Bacillota bacterium]